MFLQVNRQLYAQDDDKNTRFHLAALRNDVNFFKQNIRYVSSSNQIFIFGKNKNGFTPFHLAAIHGHNEIISVCLNSRITQASTPYGTYPLGCAAENGHVSTATLLLDSHPPELSRYGCNSYNYVTDQHNTPAHLAAQGGHLEILQLFAEKEVLGGWIHRQNINKFTPLCLAAQYGHQDVVRYLFSQGAKINKNELGRAHRFDGFSSYTPLMLAAANNHHEVVGILLRREACVDDHNVKGDTALSLAVDKQHHTTVEILLKNILDKRPLHPKERVTLNNIADRVWLHTTLRRLDDVPRVERSIPLNDVGSPHFICALCCVMSSHLETSHYQKLKPDDINKHNARRQFLTENGWQALLTSEELKIVGEGYFGVAFHKTNPQTGIHEIIIAHRGTCFDEPGNVVADVAIMEKVEPTKIMALAKGYTEAICSLYLTSNIIHAGFSLGGFIAANCVSLTNEERITAVTFDAPGIDYLPIEPVIQSTLNQRIINYVTTPNLVNTANRHIGDIRRLVVFPEYLDKAAYSSSDVTEGIPVKILNMSTWHELMKTSKSHNLDKIIQAVSTANFLCYEEIAQWPVAVIEVKRSSQCPFLPQSIPSFGFSSVGAAVISSISMAYHVGTTSFAQLAWEWTQDPNSGQGVESLKYQRGNTIKYAIPPI
tara:strand:- start:32857 stop:34824 length:1968 start_codon:yes stop_codon:yes gene_type:complete